MQVPYICSLSRELSLDADTDTSMGTSSRYLSEPKKTESNCHVRTGHSKEDEENRRESSGSFVEKEIDRKVRDLASAILQVAQMVEDKYFKSPLGEDEKDKKKRVREEEKRRKVGRMDYRYPRNTIGAN